MRLVGVRFGKSERVDYFNARDLELQKGDVVVIDTEKGASLGTVITLLEKEAPKLSKRSVREVIKKATDEDVEERTKLKEKEKGAFELCLQVIRELELPMKLVEAEYLVGGSKIIFYFTADQRVDFRELVRRLAAQLKVRIEMRQIGVRDEAKMVGGIGYCGRPLCCTTFLQDFELVSIKMAKEQNLPLNPTKISGLCDRLMCCLGFEVDAYHELKKNLPKVGKRITTTHGEGKVIRQNLLLQTITVELTSGGIVTIKAGDLER